MIDIFIGLFVLLFIYIGAREGLVKTLASIVLIFFSLFVATAAVGSFSRISSEFTNPSNLAAVTAFTVVWVIIYAVFELLLGLLLRKVITITVLGALDKVAGNIFGAVKGLLLVGIIVQLIICFPVEGKTKQAILNSLSAKFSLAAYHWAAPVASRSFSPLGEIGKANLIDSIQAKKIPASISKEVEVLSKMQPDKIIQQYQKTAVESQKQLDRLINDNNLLKPDKSKK